jgi:hypothetical protein
MIIDRSDYYRLRLAYRAGFDALDYQRRYQAGLHFLELLRARPSRFHAQQPAAQPSNVIAIQDRPTRRLKCNSK